MTEADSLPTRAVGAGIAFDLSSTDRLVLLLLASRNRLQVRVSQEELAVEGDFHRWTVHYALRRLRECGLVDFPATTGKVKSYTLNL